MSALSPQSESKLAGVFPPLASAVRKFTMWYDIHVANGGRTLDEQKADVAKGLSKTMNSMHLIQKDGYFHAVDIESTPQNWDNSPPAMIDGRPITVYEVEQIAMLFAFKAFAHCQGLEVRIGADWNNNNRWADNKFQDLDHAEAPVL